MEEEDTDDEDSEEEAEEEEEVKDICPFSLTLKPRERFRILARGLMLRGRRDADCRTKKGNINHPQNIKAKEALNENP